MAFAGILSGICKFNDDYPHNTLTSPSWPDTILAAES